ncbi:MAG: autotransporter-associated beta strand repeat-containing protein, partial [Pirellulaceae bacterium]|nr:autotransporter-associated beta strand repeat-containing protein [Pirellulaceae bacterium]
ARRGVRLEGGDGDDILIGGVADDVLLGGRGFDLLDAGAAFELLGGVAEPVQDSSGRDLLVGGGDSDFLDGRDDDDTLIGDYDAALDPPPVDAALRREGADVLQSLGVGQVRVFADNRGLSSDVHGPPALAPRDARNTIAIADPRGVVFAEPEDDLRQGDSSGELKLDARGQTVTLTDRTISLAGGRPLEFGDVQTIEVLNATGTVTIVGTPQNDVWTIRGDLPNYSLPGGPSVSLPGAASVVFVGGGGNDSLVLDYGAGNPLPGTSLRFEGGARVGLPGNGIRVLGTGGEAVELLAAGRLWGSGTLLLPDKSSLVFTDVEPLEVAQLGHFTLRTPGGPDLIKINPAATAGGATANVISGTASGFGMAELLVSDVAELTIDVGHGDTPRDHDQIFVDSAGLLARGLRHVSLLAGDGDDSLLWDSPTFETADRGTVHFDAGPGRDTLRAGANVDFTLDPSTLSSSGGGELQLSGLDGDVVQLSGGAAANQFTIRDWSGSVLLDGQALTDSVAASLTGGTLSTVDGLQLSGTLITSAASSSARVEGLIELPVTRTFQVANGGAADDLVVSAVLSGAGGLTKQGTGLLRLVADNSYRGVTTVGAGTLLVLGSQPSSPVLVNQGTLGGTGRLGITTVAGGVLAPGDNGAGILELQGGLTLESSGTLALDVRGTLPGQLHDQLRVEGPVSLGNSRLLVSSTFFLSGVGTSLTLIDNDRADSVQGTFAGLPEGTLLNLNRRNFRISYRGGDGNDVTLTHVNTPSAFAQRMVTTPVDENGVVLLTGMIVEEDPLDDFRLVIDWGDGSDVEQHLFPAGTIEVTLSHVYADNLAGGGSYVVDLDWRDPHGGGNHDQLLAEVNNVAPSVAIEGPASGVRGQSRLFEFQAEDPSPVDQQGEFQWTVAWGDGSTSTFVGSSQVEREHRYAQLGTYLVQAWAVDKDGGQSPAGSRAIEILAADLQDGVLVVGGTSARDVILVRPVDDSGTVSVRVNHLRLGEYQPAEIVVYAQDGHDTVILQSGRYEGKFVPLAVPAVLFGGEGHDRLLATGSVADNLLVGGGGQDLIRDGDGRDILFGGGDRDLLLASGESDLLWGGWTPYDDDLPSLRLLAAEWNRRDVPLADRQAHLRGELPGGANGGVQLHDTALVDDGQLDWLLGDEREDWLLAAAGDVAPRRGRSGL